MASCHDRNLGVRSPARSRRYEAGNTRISILPTTPSVTRTRKLVYDSTHEALHELSSQTFSASLHRLAEVLQYRGMRLGLLRLQDILSVNRTTTSTSSSVGTAVPPVTVNTFATWIASSVAARHTGTLESVGKQITMQTNVLCLNRSMTAAVIYCPVTFAAQVTCWRHLPTSAAQSSSINNVPLSSLSTSENITRCRILSFQPQHEVGNGQILVVIGLGWNSHHVRYIPGHCYDFLEHCWIARRSSRELVITMGESGRNRTAH